MRISPQKTNIAMVFPSSKEEEEFYEAWSSYINKIYHYENPEKKTLQQLEKLYWTRFSLSHWCWDNHCFLPEVKPEPPRRPWRYEMNKDGIRGNNVFEVYFEETREWKVMDKNSRAK